MDRTNRLLLRKESYFDVISLTAVILLPSLIHFLNFDLSIIEPFRIIILASLFLRNRLNSLILCILLPFITNLISGHPYLIKSSLIAAELSLNVMLFYLFSGRMKRAIISISASILISKLFYYGVKYILISVKIIDGSLVSTPLLYQLITFIAFSLMFAFTYTKKRG